MTRALVLRPAVGMRQIVATPYVAALGICDALPYAALAWPHTVMDPATGEELCALRAHAGYDEGMYVSLELAYARDLPQETRAQVEEALQARVDQWAQALAGAPALGPLAPVLADYADALDWLGSEVEVCYPNGKPYARGAFVGVDVWGRATVRLASGQELEFAPERYRIQKG